MARPRPTSEKRGVEKIPGIGALASLVARVAAIRMGRVPLGHLLLLPVALFLDFFDAADELFGGPVGVVLSFFLESGFVMGLTGRATYGFAFAGVDLIPGVDIIPFATITLVREMARAWNEPAPGTAAPPSGPIIDV